jgi:hypothetical protein
MSRSKRTMEEVRADREEKAARWRRLLDDGVYSSRAELAHADGVSGRR